MLGERMKMSGWPSVRSWLFSWECALVLLLAGFLRFYQIQTTEFDDDQAMLFRMAYDAVHQGLLPATSNTASIGTAHPPGAIYLLMLPAALSANPLWAALMIGIFSTGAVVLTYIFTRRYYGPVAGLVAALLYATAARPLIYARFIWQPNLMPLFVLLFLFALFGGVVERRRGWFFWALLLLGVLYQLHPITALLIIPLLFALLLVPATVRWRDLAFACIVLVIIFLPYLLWQGFTHFADLRTVFTLAKQHAHLDDQALLLYRSFLSPYDSLPSYPTSVLRTLGPFIAWLRTVVPLLALAGFAMAGALVLFPRLRDIRKSVRIGLGRGLVNRAPTDVCAPTDLRAPADDGVDREVGASTGFRVATVLRAAADFRADPYRCGLALLLVWQIGPLALLLRHSVGLHAQYLFMLMPGPFILIGLFVSWLVRGLRRYGTAGRWMRYGLYVLIALVVCGQILGSLGTEIDASGGYFNDRSFQPYPYHNDLASLQRAVGEADDLALRSHSNHVYITTDAATQTALGYLAEHMRTPTTLFSAESCLVLPASSYGPAVLLVGPYDSLTDALLPRFAHARQVEQLPRLGGPPFKLYLVTPSTAQDAAQAQFAQHLALLSQKPEYTTAGGASWLVTRWHLLRSEQPRTRTGYGYEMSAQLGGDGQQSLQSQCTLSAMRAGDQLVVAFGLAAGVAAPTSVRLQAHSFMTVPYDPSSGPIRLETASSQDTPWIPLSTTNGQQSITLSAQ
jgi:hypothetical protein